MFIKDFKIKCKISSDNGFTEGKIYEVIDGRIIDDDGIPRPAVIKQGEKITSVEDIKNYKDGNWSWIGLFINLT